MAHFEVEKLYTPDDQTQSVSFVHIDGPNPSGVVINTLSDASYVLTSGSAVFNVNGILMPLLETGAEIVIPRGSRYTDYGTQAVLLATLKPAFDEASVVPAVRHDVMFDKFLEFATLVLDGDDWGSDVITVPGYVDDTTVNQG